MTFYRPPSAKAGAPRPRHGHQQPTPTDAMDDAASVSTVSSPESDTMAPPAKRVRARYDQAGHSRKLKPIIENLNRLDHDQTIWEGVRSTVRAMELAFEIAKSDLEDSRHIKNLENVLQSARDALRAQSELFRSHRQICVGALSLREQFVE